MLIGNLCADHATFFQNTYNVAGCQAQPSEPAGNRKETVPLFHETMVCRGDRCSAGEIP